MKSQAWKMCWLLCTLGLQAQSALDWSTLDGGGGTSTGGVYSVTGTIGQPDAGMMSGGNYTLVGGFWGVVTAVQTSDAPWLTVTCSNAAVLVSWPASAEGWRLHTTANLLSVGSVWTELPPPYPTRGTNCVVTEPALAGNRLYRLHKPSARSSNLKGER